MSTGPGFLVWNPSRSLPTQRHSTFTSAKTEAERAANRATLITARSVHNYTSVTHASQMRLGCSAASITTGIRAASI